MSDLSAGEQEQTPPQPNEEDAGGAGTPEEIGGPAQRESAVTHRHIRSEGPLPAPWILAEYEEKFPGLDLRIVEQAEKESEVRRQFQREAFEEEIAAG